MNPLPAILAAIPGLLAGQPGAWIYPQHQPRQWVPFGAEPTTPCRPCPAYMVGSTGDRVPVLVSEGTATVSPGECVYDLGCVAGPRPCVALQGYALTLVGALPVELRRGGQHVAWLLPGMPWHGVLQHVAPCGGPPTADGFDAYDLVGVRLGSVSVKVGCRRCER